MKEITKNESGKKQLKQIKNIQLTTDNLMKIRGGNVDDDGSIIKK